MLLRLQGTQALRVGIEGPACEVVDIRIFREDPKTYVHGLGLITLKEPGQHYWASRGTTKYAGAQYTVYRILDIREDNLIAYDNIPVMEWPVKATPKSREDILTKLHAVLPHDVVVHVRH
jgi:hypothetical protein